MVDIQVEPWLSVDKAVVLLLDTRAKKKFSPELIVFGSLSGITASTEMGSILSAHEKTNSIQMIFALQSNKLGLIILTVWYFKTVLSTEHFPNPITVLNSQGFADCGMEMRKLRRGG